MFRSMSRCMDGHDAEISHHQLFAVPEWTMIKRYA
jgi:hypothetical protein